MPNPSTAPTTPSAMRSGASSSPATARTGAAPASSGQTRVSRVILELHLTAFARSFRLALLQKLANREYLNAAPTRRARRSDTLPGAACALPVNGVRLATSPGPTQTDPGSVAQAPPARSRPGWTDSNSAAESTSSASGQPRPAASARPNTRETVLALTDRITAV